MVQFPHLSNRVRLYQQGKLALNVAIILQLIEKIKTWRY